MWDVNAKIYPIALVNWISIIASKCVMLYYVDAYCNYISFIHNYIQFYDIVNIHVCDLSKTLTVM